MARPLRIELEGALYHVSSRGDGEKEIYRDDQDRQNFISVLYKVCKRFNWIIYAYCLMGADYQLLIETPDKNLSQGMRQLNGVYTQTYNRKHDSAGHVFQGRYKSVIVQSDNYLQEMSRYVVLSPVRDNLVQSPKDWQWSSYRACCGMTDSPNWLKADRLLASFANNRDDAIERYRQFIEQGKDSPSPMRHLRNQIFLGDEKFVETMRKQLDLNQDLSEIPRSQWKRSAQPLEYFAARHGDRNEAIVAAYNSGGFSLKEIGNHFGLHYSSVSKIVKQFTDSKFKT